MGSKRITRSRAGLALAFASWCSFAGAEPGLRQLRESQDPLLLKAKAVDLSFQPPEKANQKEAESLYLEFIAKRPQDPLVPYLYYSLGQMYSGRVDPDWRKQFGHVRDDKKAYQYFTSSWKAHPPDTLSFILMDARMCAAALAPTYAQRVAEYSRYYQWLQRIEQNEVAARMWLTEEERKRLESSPPEFVKRSLERFWEERESSMRVAARNMVGVAAGADGEAPKLLDQIIADLPDSAPAELAAKVRAKPEFSPEPFEAAPRGRAWIFAGGVALLGILVLAVVLGGIVRKRRASSRGLT